MATSRRAQRKAEVIELLRTRQLDALRGRAAAEPTVAGTLSGLLSEPDDLLRWRAIEALGWVVGDFAKQNLETARVQVRRQLWTMTEESGGIAWHAPEAVGEMLFRVPELAADLTTVLAATGHEAPFETGVLWAMGRLAHGPGRTGAALWWDLYEENLRNDSPARRGYAALATGALGLRQAIPHLEALVEDQATFMRYDFETGALREVSVGELAREALRGLV